MSRTPRHNPDLGYGRPMPWIDHTGGPTVADLDMPRWHADAACSGADAWWWFVDAKKIAARDALATCAGCPVRRTCLAAALVYAEEYGIWGGLTAVQRTPLLGRLSAGEPLGDVLDTALDTALDHAIATTTQAGVA